MKKDVKHFVRIYVKCQSTKSIYKKKYGLCKLLLILSEPWEGMDIILMVVDQFSKLAKMVPTKTVATTFNFNKIPFRYVGEAPWDASILHKQ
jgi:hypothetical protein